LGKPPADPNVLPEINAQALELLAIILILRNYLRRSPARTYPRFQKLSINESSALKINFWICGAAKRS
jgi:hypothetical protein